jgi:hypothetical protein
MHFILHIIQDVGVPEQRKICAVFQQEAQIRLQKSSCGIHYVQNGSGGEIFPILLNFLAAHYSVIALLFYLCPHRLLIFMAKPLILMKICPSQGARVNFIERDKVLK